MKKKITCIECPLGCSLSVEIENHKAVNVSGNKCPKGVPYAETEVENPCRILTTTVLTEGLALKAIPVRTDRPIPKTELFRAMEAISRLRITGSVRTGDVITADLLGLGVDLVATRGWEAEKHAKS